MRNSKAYQGSVTRGFAEEDDYDNVDDFNAARIILSHAYVVASQNHNSLNNQEPCRPMSSERADQSKTGIQKKENSN